MPKRRFLTLAASVACLFLGPGSFQVALGQAAEKETDGRVDLDRMARTYANCKTYRDTGLVKTHFTLRSGSWTDETSFQTVFVRPDKFRFEFVEFGRRYIVWRSGAAVRSWWDLESQVETEDSLDTAIASATGVSARSAHTIPALLMPAELSGRKLTELSEPSRLPDAPLGNNQCIRIQGRLGPGVLTIWLDKATYLVRQIDEKRPGNVEQSTTYSPVIDGAISEELLAFNAPKALMWALVKRWPYFAVIVLIVAAAIVRLRTSRRATGASASVKMTSFVAPPGRSPAMPPSSEGRNG